MAATPATQACVGSLLLRGRQGGCATAALCFCPPVFVAAAAGFLRACGAVCGAWPLLGAEEEEGEEEEEEAGVGCCCQCSNSICCMGCGCGGRALELDSDDLT